MTTDGLPLGTLLRQHGVHLKKSLGQNFLADPVHLNRIVEAAELVSDDVVLEIGAGVGTLTIRLAQRAGRVVAVELDERLLPLLRETLAGIGHVSVVQGDILQLSPSELTTRDYKVVANLPYYITSAAIRHLLTATPPPKLTVLTIQKEVAQRIIASPPNMSLLAVSVQFYAQPEIVARIPAGAFYPPPKVDSAILRLRPHSELPVRVPDVDTFFQVVRAGFSQRRKQLRNALKSGLAISSEQAEVLLESAAVSPQRRAETLTLDDWARISAAWAGNHT